MAVDLGELVPSLRREVGSPGVGLYDLADDDYFLGKLQDAFWTARLHGMLAGYEEADGEVTPLSGDDDLGRDLQQLIVLYAAFSMVLTQYQNATSVRSKAGPVESEVQRSATVLRATLDALRERLKLVVDNISSYGGDSGVLVFDAVLSQSYYLR